MLGSRAFLVGGRLDEAALVEVLIHLLNTLTRLTNLLGRKLVLGQIVLHRVSRVVYVLRVAPVHEVFDESVL